MTGIFQVVPLSTTGGIYQGSSLPPSHPTSSTFPDPLCEIQGESGDDGLCALLKEGFFSFQSASYTEVPQSQGFESKQRNPMPERVAFLQADLAVD